jgi:hypothetical protein
LAASVASDALCATERPDVLKQCETTSSPDGTLVETRFVYPGMSCDAPAARIRIIDSALGVEVSSWEPGKVLAKQPTQEAIEVFRRMPDMPGYCHMWDDERKGVVRFWQPLVPELAEACGPGSIPRNHAWRQLSLPLQDGEKPTVTYMPAGIQVEMDSLRRPGQETLLWVVDRLQGKDPEARDKAAIALANAYLRQAEENRKATERKKAKALPRPLEPALQPGKKSEKGKKLPAENGSSFWPFF